MKSPWIDQKSARASTSFVDFCRLRLCRFTLQFSTDIFALYGLFTPLSGFSEIIVPSRQFCCTFCYWENECISVELWCVSRKCCVSWRRQSRSCGDTLCSDSIWCRTHVAVLLFQRNEVARATHGLIAAEQLLLFLALIGRLIWNTTIRSDWLPDWTVGFDETRQIDNSSSAIRRLMLSVRLNSLTSMLGRTYSWPLVPNSYVFASGLPMPTFPLLLKIGLSPVW